MVPASSRSPAMTATMANAEPYQQPALPRLRRAKRLNSLQTALHALFDSVVAGERVSPCAVTAGDEHRPAASRFPEAW